MNDSILQDLLELARSATDATHATFVLNGEDERVELSLPVESGIDLSTEQIVEPTVRTENIEGGRRTITTAPVIGPLAQAGWVAVAHDNIDPDQPRTRDVVSQIARLIEERLDRDAEQVRLDELGELLRDNQERLHITRDELSLSNRELEQFAYIAAHELVAPLRAVAVYAEILESVAPTELTDDPTAIRNCVNEIRSGVQHMTRQVHSLLELSNNELDADAAEPTKLNTIVQSALDTLAQPLDELNAVVTVDDLPIVMAAPVPLQSVFANLFSNAIRYRSPERPLRIQVTTTTTSTGHRIEVIDNGSGVAEADQARIFNMFERASTTKDGSGIGLALSRKIVNLFGASIGVAPASTEGSIFWLEFPALDAEDTLTNGH